MNPWPVIKRFLRRPAVILGEIAALATAAALGAALPEKHVFQSAGFALIALMAGASLAVVVAEQFRRVRFQWCSPLTPAQFQFAPLQKEIERPATGSGATQKIWSERRIGLAGSLVFHIGLLLLITAGAWRALFGREAAVDLLEGETVAAHAAWPVQWPGVFGGSFQLEKPITLESVRGGRYADGNLRELSARFSAGEIAVNQQLQAGDRRLYLAQEFGPAALLEWNAARRDAVLLTDRGGGDFFAETTGPAGLKLFIHAQGERPARFDVRVMRDNVLFVAGSLVVGSALVLPDGGVLALRGSPMWARLHGSHDSALGLAYLGMIFTMAGAAMMFCLIKRDYCVIITPLGDREKVFLALKPQRFTPLFQERFEEFVCSELRRRRHDEAQTAADKAPKISCVGPGNFVRAASVVLFLAGFAFLSGCDRVSPADAKKLVERYNQVVSEAYRRGDVKLIDPVVGPNEGRKLTGLIGVRLDIGITLDSQLLSLDVTGIEQKPNELFIRTKEKWSYRDLKIGSGEQVGQASEDFYEMTYYFTNINKTWLVDEIKFAAMPQVSRTNTPWVAERSAMHGVTTPEAAP